MTFILEQAQPDLIFHLAAQPLVSTSHRDPWGTLETNIHMQLNVLEGVARVRPACRIVVVGSGEEYGLVSAGDLPIDEDTALRPLNAYATSKVTQDLLGLQYHLTRNLDVVRVRPFNHIGPRQRVGFVAPDFASQIAAIELGQKPPTIRVGNLAARRDFCDVRDVVQAYLLLAKAGESGQVYNIGSGESHAIQELLETLLGMSRISIEVVPDPDRLRPSDVPNVICDATRIRRETGWEPAIPFEQSLNDILDYWRREIGERA
jgi:GDP-4-dehydro-6-deoxy-D-mannose reductase